MLMAHTGFPFFLRLNDIPSYAYTIIFFIHSSMDGHLGGFYLLAMVNWFMNKVVQISF